MLRDDCLITEKNSLKYVLDSNNRMKRLKPWLGDLFSFAYDSIMENSIFPKKFDGDIEKHYAILRRELAGMHGRLVLDLAAGSGSAVRFLANDNHYTGTDISPGLLRQAVKRFRGSGFAGSEFYVTAADDLPFAEDSFDLCICVLSLNFFENLEAVLREMNRILKQGSVLSVRGSGPREEYAPEHHPRHHALRGRVIRSIHEAGLSIRAHPRGERSPAVLQGDPAIVAPR